MIRGNYRGRGEFGAFCGAGNPRGGGRPRGGGNGGDPRLSNRLHDLEIEIQLLQRKRQILEQEQNMRERFANSTSNYYSSSNSNQYTSGSNHYSTNSNNYCSNNSNKRQYDSKQPFHNYSQQGTSNQFNFANHSAAYQPGPGSSNFEPLGVKRQAYAPVWQNQYQYPSPPIHFNAPQSINPWLLPTPRQAEFRAVNQNPPQLKNFSAQTRSLSLMAQQLGIGQRIKNQYNPPPERKKFTPNKVTKHNQRPAAIAPVYYPSIAMKKVIDEGNKLIAYRSKILGQPLKPQGQNPQPKGHYPPTKVHSSPKVINTPPKSQNPAQNTIPKQMKKRFEQDNGEEDRQPSGQINGGLELALGMILKSVKELCPDPGTLEYFNIPFIQSDIKHTLRVRIRDVMMNEPIDNVRNIVDKYREKYPQTTDIELMKIAQDAYSYNNNQWRVLQLVEADNPEDFFKKNIGKILHNKLHDVFTDLQKLYENKDHKIEELVESFTKDDPKENKNDDEIQGNENGGKDTSGEIITIEEEDTSGDKNTAVEKDTHGDKDKNVGKDSDEEKTTNVEKEKDTDQGKDKNGKNVEKKNDKSKSNTKCAEGSSEDINMVVDQLQNKSSNTQKYVEFMEKVIEQKLPGMLHKFKDEFMSILCMDKEFISLKALINLETKSKLRQALQQDIDIIIDDDMETSPSGKTPTNAKSTAAVNYNAGKPAATAAKPAAPSPTTKSLKPGAPSPNAKSAATATTPASNIIQYVKLIGRPALPARSVIYEFLNQFSPASIKMHKSIKNLLVVGFVDKEGFDKILAANESVVGDATIIVQAIKPVNTPGQNKTPQQNRVGQQGNKIPAQNKESELNETSNQKNEIHESVQNGKTPAQTDTSEDVTEENKSTDENKLTLSIIDDIFDSDLDAQISDLLLSIQKDDEEERADHNKPNGGEEMDTKDTDEKI